MKWEYFGTGLALLGIGVTMVLALPPPWWLNMPKWMVRGGLFVGLALVIYGCTFTTMGVWPEYLRPRLMPLLAMSAGAFLFVAGVIWFGQIQTNGKTNRSTLDGIVKLECLKEIFHLPSDGKLLEIVVNDDSARNITFQSHWLSEFAYKTNPNIIPAKYGMIDKCRVTNFGSTPVFNVKLSLEAVFVEHIPLKEKMFEQKEIDRKTVSFQVDQVNAGADSGVDIYVWNTTRFNATLMFSNGAELQRLGSTEREVVRLIPAQRMIALFPAGT